LSVEWLTTRFDVPAAVLAGRAIAVRDAIGRTWPGAEDGVRAPDAPGFME